MAHITDTIVEVNARLTRGDTTREALVTQALVGAASSAAAHVFTKLYADAALAAARNADAAHAAGVVQPALAGLPVTIKDLYGVAGETTMSGSIVCRGEPVQLADAPAVARLRAAGSVSRETRSSILPRALIRSRSTSMRTRRKRRISRG